MSLGEVMLRLGTGEGRIRTAHSFRAWKGGGKYNVMSRAYDGLEIMDRVGRAGARVKC